MAKKTVYKFSQEDLTMYNTVMVGATIRSVLGLMIEKGFIQEEEVREIFPSEMVLKNGLQKRIDKETLLITNGEFDLDYFKYEEEED